MMEGSSAIVEEGLIVHMPSQTILLKLLMKYVK